MRKADLLRDLRKADLFWDHPLQISSVLTEDAAGAILGLVEGGEANRAVLCLPESCRPQNRRVFGH